MTIKKNIILVILSFLLWSGVSFAQAQQESFKGKWWVNIGAGGAQFNFKLPAPLDNALKDHGPAATLSYNYMVTRNQLLTIRGTGTIGLRSMAAGDLFCTMLSPLTGKCDTSETTIGDMGILYGYIYKKAAWYWSTSAGIAAVRAQAPEVTVLGITYEPKAHYKVGLPAEFQLFLTPSQRLGIGLIGFANLNDGFSVAGLMVAIQLGNLR